MTSTTKSVVPVTETLSWNPMKIVSKLYNAVFCSNQSQKQQTEEPYDLELQSSWFQAVKKREVSRVKDLIDRGVDVNMKDENGWNALHLAAWNDHTDICEMLLRKSSTDKNMPGPGGCSPLALACQRGNVNTTKCLIRAKCDLHQKAQIGPSADVTALHLAAQHGHAEVVQLLVNAGASVNAGMIARGVKGITPLHLAVERNHMAVLDILLGAGCNVQSATQSDKETTC